MLAHLGPSYIGRSHPFIDQTLAQIDSSLGFNWIQYFEWQVGHPVFGMACRIAYLCWPLYALFIVALSEYHLLDRHRDSFLWSLRPTRNVSFAASQFFGAVFRLQGHLRCAQGRHCRYLRQRDTLGGNLVSQFSYDDGRSLSLGGMEHASALDYRRCSDPLLSDNSRAGGTFFDRHDRRRRNRPWCDHFIGRSHSRGKVAKPRLGNCEPPQENVKPAALATFETS